MNACLANSSNHPYHLCLLLTLHAWNNSLTVSGLSLKNKCACWLVKQRVNLVNSTPFPLRLFSSCWMFYCQLSLSWSTSLLTPVDSLRPGKRRLCYHLSRSLVWTLRSKISVQSVTSLIFLNCRRGLGLSSLWSIWLPTIYILSFNRRINSNTARRRPYLKLRTICWCLWTSNMSPCSYY